MTLPVLPQADRRTQAILDTALDGVLVMNAAGLIADWNLAAETIFGWSREEVIGQPLAETIVPPALRQAHWQGLRHYLATGHGPVLGRRLELPAVRRDGTEFPVELSIKELPQEEGGERLFVGFIRDISVRRAAERALQESERRHRFFADLGEIFRSMRDPRSARQSALRLLGEHLGASRCAYGEVREAGETFHVLDEWCREGEPMLGEYQRADFGDKFGEILHQGQTLVLPDTMVPRLTPRQAAQFAHVGTGAFIAAPVLRDGALHGVLSVVQTTARAWKPEEVALVEEATERVWTHLERARAEGELRQAAARFRALADNISQLAWMSDATGAIFWYNQQWYEYTGTTPEQVAASGWKTVHHPDHKEQVEAKFRLHLLTGEVWEDTFPLRGANGEYRWFLSRARPIRNEAGEITLWFGTNTDVTEQRAFVEELRAARDQAEAGLRAKDNFLATLSHELRTPLTPVLMSAAELRAQSDLPEELRRDLALIHRNVQLEARLIDDLLDLTRIARGRLPLRPEACDAHALLQHAVEIVREEIRTREQTLVLDLEAGEYHLHADSARLQQVFWNLLRNAVKFTPKGGALRVRTRNTEDGHLLLEFVDTGRGLLPKAMEIIFKPFEQAGLENDHRFGGLGLGLAIAQAIVTLHGGRISVQSEGLNKGATFTVDLPGATAEPPPEAALPPPATPAKAAESLHLLLVEDHEQTMSILKRLLTRAGHHLVTATNVAEALAAAREHHFDGVISDIGLPDGSGLDLMPRLREEYGLRGIALSGYGMEEDQRRSQAAGFTAHLTKPIDFSQLRNALSHFTPEAEMAPAGEP